MSELHRQSNAFSSLLCLRTSHMFVYWYSLALDVAIMVEWCQDDTTLSQWESPPTLLSSTTDIWINQYHLWEGAKHWREFLPSKAVMESISRITSMLDTGLDHELIDTGRADSDLST